MIRIVQIVFSSVHRCLGINRYLSTIISREKRKQHEQYRHGDFFKSSM